MIYMVATGPRRIVVHNVLLPPLDCYIVVIGMTDIAGLAAGFA